MLYRSCIFYTFFQCHTGKAPSADSAASSQQAEGEERKGENATNCILSPPGKRQKETQDEGFLHRKVFEVEKGSKSQKRSFTSPEEQGKEEKHSQHEKKD